MVDIDEIMEMLDWNQPEEIQKKGRELARQVRTLSVFLRPYYDGKSKSLWENCAIILSVRTDEELSHYLTSLFVWITDLNWPGALIIFERLKNFKTNSIDDDIKWHIEEARQLNNLTWLENLECLYKTRKSIE